MYKTIIFFGLLQQGADMSKLNRFGDFYKKDFIKITILFIIIIFCFVVLPWILADFDFAFGSESDLPDPTRIKTPAQKTVEKFLIFYYNQDFEAAAKLTINTNNLESLNSVIEYLRNNYNKDDEPFKKTYADILNREFTLKTLEPQTLFISRGAESKDKNFIIAYLTENHKVLMPSGEIWHFYWRMQWIITLNEENKIMVISLNELIKPSLLMVLKPENCIRPVICD